MTMNGGTSIPRHLVPPTAVPPPAGAAELGEVLRAILGRLEAIDARVGNLEVNTSSVPALVAELEGFRPLLEQARKRMDRGSHLTGMFGGGGKEKTK